MNGTLYKNNSDRIVVSKDLSNTHDITLHFKDNSEVINPIIYISRGVELLDFNYIYVAGKIKRFYYINEIEVSQQYYILHCHVDVLHTYRNQIYKQSAIIDRNAERYNLYLDDSEVLLYNMTRTETFKWDNGFDVTEGSSSSKVASYLLVVNGSGEPEPEPEPTPTPNNEGGEE